VASSKEKITANAMKFLQKGSLEKAVREFEKILEIDPSDERTLQKVGDLYARMNRTQEALSAYRRVADLYTKHGFYAKAIAVINQILLLEPEQKDLHGKLAEMYQQLGLLNETTQQYRILHDHYEKTGRHREALDILRRVALIDRNNLPVRIKLAEGYLKSEMRKEGLDEYERLAEDLRLDNRQDEYVRVLDRLVHHFPERIERGRELAALYLERGETRKGLMRLKTVLKERSDDVETLGLLARAFRDLNQLAKTITVLKEIARICHARKDANGMRDAYRRILEIDPENPDARKVLEKETFKPGVPSDTLVPQSESQLETADAFSQLTMGEQAPSRKTQTKAAAGPAESAAINVVKLFTEAEVFVKYGLHDQAELRLKTLLQTEPNNLSALQLLRTIYEVYEDDAKIAEVDARIDAAQNRPDSDTHDIAPDDIDILEPSIDFDQDIEFAHPDEEADDDEQESEAPSAGAPEILEALELPSHMRGQDEQAAPEQTRIVTPPSLPQADDIEIEEFNKENVDELLVGEVLAQEPEKPTVKPQRPSRSGSIPLPSGTLELTIDDMTLVDDSTDAPEAGADADDDGEELVVEEEELELDDIEEAEFIDDEREPESADAQDGPEDFNAATSADEQTPLEFSDDILFGEAQGDATGTDEPADSDFGLEGVQSFEAPSDLRSDRQEPAQGGDIPTVDLAEVSESETDIEPLPDLPSGLSLEREFSAQPLDWLDVVGPKSESRPLFEDEPTDRLDTVVTGELLDADEAPEELSSSSADLVDQTEATHELSGELPDAVLDVEPADESPLEAIALDESELALDDTASMDTEVLDDLDSALSEADLGEEGIDSLLAEEEASESGESDFGDDLALFAEPEIVEDTAATDSDEFASYEAEPVADVADRDAEPFDLLDVSVPEPLGDAALDSLERLLSEGDFEDLQEAEFFLQQAIYSEALDLYKQLVIAYPDEALLKERVSLCREAIARQDEQTADVRSRLTTQPEEPLPEWEDADFAPERIGPPSMPPPLPDEGAGTVNLSQEIMDDLDAEESGPGAKSGASKTVAPRIEDEVETHLNLGIAYREMGLIDEAIGEFLVPHKTGNATVRTAVMLGLCYLQKKMRDRAVDFFRDAIGMPDLNVERFMQMRYDLGQFYLENERTPSALRQFKILEDIDPEFLDVMVQVRDLEKRGIEPAMPDAVDELLDGVDLDSLPDDYDADKHGRKDRVSYV
jgi:tetratricopeptide (TPR) repeat protein